MDKVELTRPVKNLVKNGAPFRVITSDSPTVAAYTLISTSLYLGTGFSTSLSWRTSGGPYFVHTIAFMSFLLIHHTQSQSPTRPSQLELCLCHRNRRLRQVAHFRKPPIQRPRCETLLRTWCQPILPHKSITESGSSRNSVLACGTRDPLASAFCPLDTHFIKPHDARVLLNPCRHGQ